MYQDYSPILLLIVFAVILLALPLIIQSIISPKQNKGGDKLIPFECGELPEGSAWVKFNIRFYVIALIFIIFDVEIVFMFPWATIFNENQLFYFIEMFIFMGILLVGLAYVWVKGDLDWVKMELKYAKGRYKDLAIKEKSNE